MPPDPPPAATEPTVSDLLAELRAAEAEYDRIDAEFSRANHRRLVALDAMSSRVRADGPPVCIVQDGRLCLVRRLSWRDTGSWTRFEVVPVDLV